MEIISHIEKTSFVFIEGYEDKLEISNTPLDLGEDYYLDFEKVQGANTKKEVNAYFMCMICQGLVVSPTECSACDTAFCQKCIQQYHAMRCVGPAKNKKGCPSCRGIWEPKTMHRVLTSQLNSCLVTCPKECSTAPMPYEKLAAHLQESCPAVKLLCPFKCGLTFFRPEHSQHLEQCPNAWTQCLKCDCKLRFKDQADHDCFGYLMQRVKEQDHQLKTKDTIIDKMSKHEAEHNKQLMFLKEEVKNLNQRLALKGNEERKEEQPLIVGCGQKREKKCKHCNAVRPLSIGYCGGKGQCTHCRRVQVFCCAECDQKAPQNPGNQ